MDSAKSFFPTRADLLSRKQRRLYRLCRGASSDGPAFSTLDPASSSNIFRDGGDARDAKDARDSEEVGRPIGGEELFRRMEQLAQERRLEGRKLRRTSREYHPRNVQTSIGPSHPLIKRTVTECDAAVLDLRMLLKRPPKETAGEELFKSHEGYQSSSERCKAVACAGKRGLVRSAQTIQAKFAPKQLIERIDRQVQAHQDKSALLGEIDRGRPLVERCGDSYFEMTLRNRFEEEVKLPGYVYRIKDRLTENRVISRLRSTHAGM